MKAADGPDSAKRALCGTAIASDERPTGKAWLRGLFGVAAGLLNVGHAAGEESAAPTEYRAAAAAPAEWRNFAHGLQQRLQERLAAQDEDARQFRDAIAGRAGRAGRDRPLRLYLSAWINPDGKVERVEFDGVEDNAAAENLRRLFRIDGVGAPPVDMLQPVRLGLSLRPKEPEGAGK